MVFFFATESHRFAKNQSLYNRACTQRHRIQRSPCIEQSIALVFVSCLSPEFVSP